MVSTRCVGEDVAQGPLGDGAHHRDWLVLPEIGPSVFPAAAN